MNLNKLILNIIMIALGYLLGMIFTSAFPGLTDFEFIWLSILSSLVFVLFLIPLFSKISEKS